MQLVQEFNDWFSNTPTILQPLYKYQENIVVLLEQGKSVIVNKSRQTGLSTLIACYGLTRALMGDTVIIVSPSLKQSKHVMDYIKTFLNTLREIETVSTTEETKTSLHFPNQGAIYSLPNSASTIRGIRAHLVILDEHAHFLNNTDYEIEQAVLPMISRGGQIVYISTPFGEQGLFFKKWTEQNSLEKVKIHYTECPDIKEEVIRQQYDEITWRQEFCNEFIGEVNSYFPFNVLEPCIDLELECEA